MVVILKTPGKSELLSGNYSSAQAQSLMELLHDLILAGENHVAAKGHHFSYKLKMSKGTSKIWQFFITKHD